jgi:hypothetical protein
MARFTGKDDPGFISVAGELYRMVNESKSPNRESQAAARRTQGSDGASSSGINISATEKKSLSLGGITILGDVTKSNVVSNSQTIHGGLTFTDS